MFRFNCEELERLIGGVKHVHLLPSKSGGNGHCGSGYVDFIDQHYALIALAEGAITIGGRRCTMEPVIDRGPRDRQSTPDVRES